MDLGQNLFAFLGVFVLVVSWKEVLDEKRNGLHNKGIKDVLLCRVLKDGLHLKDKGAIGGKGKEHFNKLQNCKTTVDQTEWSSDVSTAIG